MIYPKLRFAFMVKRVNLSLLYLQQDTTYSLVHTTDQEFTHEDFPGLSFNIAQVTAKPGC